MTGRVDQGCRTLVCHSDHYLSETTASGRGPKEVPPIRFVIYESASSVKGLLINRTGHCPVIYSPSKGHDYVQEVGRNHPASFSGLHLTHDETAHAPPLRDPWVDSFPYKVVFESA